MSFALLILLTGCDIGEKLDNTPTKRVETFLNKYQTLDDDVLDDSGDSDNDNFDEDDIAIVIDLSTSFWAYVFFKI